MFSPLTLIFRAMSLLDNRHDWVASDADAVCRFCVVAMAERGRRGGGGEADADEVGDEPGGDDADTDADADAEVDDNPPTHACCETAARWNASLRAIEFEQALFLSLPIVLAVGAATALMAFVATTAVYCASCAGCAEDDAVPVMFWLTFIVAGCARRLLAHMRRRVLPLIHHRGMHALLAGALTYALRAVVGTLVAVAFVLEAHVPSGLSHRLALSLVWAASLLL
ncbi:hypothetical protein Q8F55_004915 [Vanrija albida]|uniref:Uncharacterized protein n=1 Tax=Vanrija albida TaxID=181172 RepID=A0ABR3Q0X9_9TREE